MCIPYVCQFSGTTLPFWPLKKHQIVRKFATKKPKLANWVKISRSLCNKETLPVIGGNQVILPFAKVIDIKTQQSTRNKDEKNAFAKHLAIYHPEQVGNKNAFEFKLEEIHRKPLTRLCSESDFIYRTRSQIQMNRKGEWNQRAALVPRVVVTRELDKDRGRGRQQARGRRTRGRAKSFIFKPILIRP